MKQFYSLMIGVVLFASICSAQTVTKTQNFSTSFTIDGTGNYGASLTPVNFVSGVDFAVTDLVSEVSVSINFNKTDGSCGNPASGYSYHSETSFRLVSPSGTFVILAAPGTWSGGANISPVTVNFTTTAAFAPSGTPVSGNFLTNNGNLAVYQGENAFGNWTLQAGDNAGLDPLCILSYSVTLSTFNPLPIELEFFDAKLDDSERMVLLDWETASEFNNDYFQLEKSLNLYDWESFKQLPGQGTKFSPSTYNAVDENPSIGLTYYRLKQTDFNGAYSFSDIRSVYISPNIFVFPNPIQGNSFMIRGKQLKGVQTKLFDNSGRVISSKHQQVSPGILGMDISNCENGIYRLELKWANHREYVSVNIQK